MPEKQNPATMPRLPAFDPPVPVFERDPWYQEAWAYIFGRPEYKYKIFRDYVKASKIQGSWQEWTIRDMVRHEEQNPDVYHSPSVTTKGYNMAMELRDDWRPAQIDVEKLLGFREHPGALENVFFETHYLNLYVKTFEFAERWFGNNVTFHNMMDAEFVWDRESVLTPQFIEYSKLVAHEDRLKGGWPIILNDPRQRKWLITGILGQIMEMKIFNQLLFGADPETQRELDRADSIYIEKEGYGRKSHRAQIVKFGLDHHLVPRDFWIAVDELTATTAKIFMPLLNVMKILNPRPSGSEKTLKLFVQELHFILGYAGILHVCMAQDESIFIHTSATPGAFFDSATELQSDVLLYRESRDYYIIREQHFEEQAALSIAGGAINRAFGFKLPKNEAELRTIRNERRRGAKVKLAVFPKLTRFVPINKGMGQVVIDDEVDADDPNEDRQLYWPEGTSSVDIQGARVVYYQGLLKPAPGVTEAITLDQQLDRAEVDYVSNGFIHFFTRNFNKAWTLLLRGIYRLLLLAPIWIVALCIYAGWDYMLFLTKQGLVFVLLFLFFAQWNAYNLINRNSVAKGVFVSMIPFLFVGIVGYISGDDYESYDPYVYPRDVIRSLWAE
ncbi:hypothetical protein GGR53DRAFT_13827 [Hypoxylon sp. FL1150]|nr:hypothetical protein GGR53DRAFT_13827 [Hypoxylon sp. FL1150]